MDDLPSPTVRELEILKVLWDHGAKSVADVHRLLRTADGKQQHLNTVQTLLRLM
ncbi:MAG: BlaI/MecI/CopY family transcriptional regulator, partial [Gemmataceae bacterium]